MFLDRRIQVRRLKDALQDPGGEVHLGLHRLLHALDFLDGAVADGGQPFAFAAGGFFERLREALEERVIHHLPGQRGQRGDPVQGGRRGDQLHERLQAEFLAQHFQIPGGGLHLLPLGLHPFPGGRVLEDVIPGLEDFFRKRLILLARRRAGDGAEQREHVRIDPRILLFYQRPAGILFGIDQIPDQFGLGALFLEHLLGDPVGFEHAFHQPLGGEDGLRPQEVALALLGRQGIDHLLGQPAENFFLLDRREAQFRRNEGEEEFLERVVVHQRRGQHALKTAAGALEEIQTPLQQPRFGTGIAPDVDHLLDERRLRGAAGRAFYGRLNGRHGYPFKWGCCILPGRSVPFKTNFFHRQGAKDAKNF